MQDMQMPYTFQWALAPGGPWSGNLGVQTLTQAKQMMYKHLLNNANHIGRIVHGNGVVVLVAPCRPKPIGVP